MGHDPVIESAPGIRRLADPGLQASMARVLASLPEGTNAATIDVGFDSQGIQAVGVVKLQGGWSVLGMLDRRYAGDWSGHVALRWAGR
jgi:hypothetical protein